MLNNRGYIFVETIVVLTITMVCLLVLYNSYSLVLKSSISSKHYDNINDVYKVNITKKLINKDISNDLIIDKVNCINYMDTNCSLVLNNLNIETVYIINDVNNIINSDNYNKNFKKYVKTLESNTKYIIINRKENNKNYYSSLKYGGYNEK